MARNIVVFSDGTGQAGGVSFDENRSNIYKLYRATRVGPDSSINPAEQVAYYDAGLGSTPPSGGTIERMYRWLHNLISQATGLGLTANIVDCYEFIVRTWRPGDRIYLFGFSRGAYTVRCLGGVLAICGVPTKGAGGAPLKRDSTSARRLAKRAVKGVYQHASSKKEMQASPREKRFLAQRRELAQKFRLEHGSDQGGLSNAFPHSIGAFDTVAALGSKRAFIGLAVGAAVIVLALAALLAWFTPYAFWKCLAWIALGALGVGALVYLKTHLKAAHGTSDGLLKTIHLSEFRQRFYDTELNVNVPYARHALSIDENRADFDRVKWGSQRESRGPDANGIEWFEQYWFAGNHSDIGGSYPENESRLSDIPLDWMVGAARAIPFPLEIDASVLQLYPNSDGPQHDERKKGIRILTRWFGATWKEGHRTIRNDATVHVSVDDRFNLAGVLQYDVTEPYRPAPLREHRDFSKYY